MTRLLLLTLALAGCNSYSDAHIVSEITPSHFHYVAFADWASPPGNNWSEGRRLASLDDYMTQHRRCPLGYDITARNVTSEPGKGADVYTILYDVNCKIDARELPEITGK